MFIPAVDGRPPGGTPGPGLRRVPTVHSDGHVVVAPVYEPLPDDPFGPPVGVDVGRIEKGSSGRREGIELGVGVGLRCLSPEGHRTEGKAGGDRAAGAELGSFHNIWAFVPSGTEGSRSGRPR